MSHHITFIGTGYVGLVSAACFAELGHKVCGFDLNKEKITMLHNNIMPIYEDNLSDLVMRNVASNALSFTSDKDQALQFGQTIFIAVGTPEDNNGAADLSYIEQAALMIAPYVKDGHAIITKSTVPVGTNNHIRDIIVQYFIDNDIKVPEFTTISNPEFLREGKAIHDFMHPDRIVIGADSELGRNRAADIYAPLVQQGYPLLISDIATAELIKYAANCFLATKIAYINEMADLCESYHANIDDLSKGLGLDDRIGKEFLQTGPGFGGSCFPKDTRALQYQANNIGMPSSILNAVIASNNERKEQLFDKISMLYRNHFNGQEFAWQGAHIALLGLAFKGNTDDVRDSPALVLAEHLHKYGASIHAFDPAASDNARAQCPYITCYATHDEALKNADLCIIATEWPMFSLLKYDDFKDMNHHVIIDLRRLLHAHDVAPCHYIAIGQ